MESKSKKGYWDSKPYWCQPWSIISFGILVLIITWTLFHNFIITSILGFFIVLWWILFLILAPNLYEGIFDKKDP
mgnify:FL=1|tara:strand:- start:183 stop:407 length:225 start_codon:yes stop_codon:yes gene_type:complete